jgi:hypothetical protein
MVGRGEDPIAARKSAKEAAKAARAARAKLKTFGDYADDYIDAMESGWRNVKQRQQWRNSLK